ncbi:MAG: plasmid replication initiation protein [Yoonia sp.]|jgi:plasmid replication initiation protein
MAALNAGRAISRTLKLTAHDLLVATRRDTGGDSYVRLRDAFERLAGTRITTNLVTGEAETTSGFGLIEAWEIVRKSRGGRMISVTVTLSDWLFRAVQSKSVLTLNRDYFSLRKPLERRIYELARKHCGQQRTWRASVATLHTKAGSDAPLRVFRAALRRMIVDDNLPDYEMSEDDSDVMVITRKRLVEDIAGLATFGADTLEAARTMAPGWDIYALESEWRGFWVASGRQKLARPDKAFLGWLRGRITR